VLSFCKEGYLAFPAAVPEPINSRVSSFLEVLRRLISRLYTSIHFHAGPTPCLCRLYGGSLSLSDHPD
jgi:hypothetical protein